MSGSDRRPSRSARSTAWATSRLISCCTKRSARCGEMPISRSKFSASARGPATGGFSLRTILQIVCLQIDSHTGVMTTNHYCDKASMCEMFSMGPSDGSRGIHNMKGIGLRLLQASLGGMEHDAAELLAISVDGRTGAASK